LMGVQVGNDRGELVVVQIGKGGHYHFIFVVQCARLAVAGGDDLLGVFDKRFDPNRGGLAGDTTQLWADAVLAEVVAAAAIADEGGFPFCDGGGIGGDAGGGAGAIGCVGVTGGCAGATCAHDEG
jgi:hypothetical protein